MSALTNKVYTLGNLMTFDENGLSIASFVDIKKTLINRQRQLYGADIDVSDASADGQFITEIALLINNAFQAFNDLYSNLNPATAQGHALDLLASFSNIFRKPAQASICEVTLTSSSQFDLPRNSVFIDKNGTTWIIDESRSSYLPDLNTSTGKYEYATYEMQEGVVIPLICTKTGATAIPANTIEGFANVDANNANVEVTQPTNGIEGSIEESDAHLRARRNGSAALEAVTIVESIQGALMTNTNILDAFVINHTDVHTVEVIVNRKYPSGVSNDKLDNFIANTIYNRLTPGIPTTHDASTTGTGKNKLKTFSETIEASFNKEVEWVEANPIKPTLTITLQPLANYDTESAARNIIQAVATYTNNLGLLIDMNVSSMLQQIIYADPKFQGRPTYYCTPSDILLAGSAFVNKPTGATSAADCKTFYKYDTTCTASGNDYVNADSSIIIKTAQGQ